MLTKLPRPTNKYFFSSYLKENHIELVSAQLKTNMNELQGSSLVSQFINRTLIDQLTLLTEFTYLTFKLRK